MKFNQPAAKGATISFLVLFAGYAFADFDVLSILGLSLIPALVAYGIVAWVDPA